MGVEGADRYVLSDADNARIFHGQIVPSLLADATSQTDPQVVFVIGQPGSGKTAAAR